MVLLALPNSRQIKAGRHFGANFWFICHSMMRLAARDGRVNGRFLVIMAGI